MVQAANMLGEKMNVELSKHCVKRIMERTTYTPAEVLWSITLLLERKDVSEYLLYEVRIGDEVVIRDAYMNYSFSIAVDVNEIIIKTIFYDEDGKHLFVGAQQKCMILAPMESMMVISGRLFQKLAC